MSGRVRGKVAVVTGAGAGIGRAAAVLLAREGAAVVVSDIDGDAASATAEQVAAGGGQAVAVRTDVAVEEEVERAVRTAVERFGRLDVLVNNAAATALAVGGEDLDVVRTTDAVWHRTFAVNVMGTVYGCRHAIPVMLDGGGGSIVNMSSATAHRGVHSPTAYGSLKSSIETLTVYVATQFGKLGVRCNAIAPGTVLTSWTEGESSALSDEQRRRLLHRALTPHLGEAEDIANAVVFLASDESRFITGETVPVTGGADLARSDIPMLRAEEERWLHR